MHELLSLNSSLRFLQYISGIVRDEILPDLHSIVAFGHMFILKQIFMASPRDQTAKNGYDKRIREDDFSMVVMTVVLQNEPTNSKTFPISIFSVG